LMPPGLFGSTTIDCSACMEKANTPGTAGATGVVVALEPVKVPNYEVTDRCAPWPLPSSEVGAATSIILDEGM
jgi:hypothetical protein